MAADAGPDFVAARGGGFLTEERAVEEVFTLEDCSDEQRMIASTADEYMEEEVMPRLPQILALDYETIRETLRGAGRLGLLGIEVPEAYGGLGLGKVEGCLACERLARDGSFVVSFMAHTGMGTLPIVHFGTEEQKRKYLPKLASGEWIGSFSLSEAASASDAMSARASAVMSRDGRHWTLNGEKMWLTNAGLADVYITFAMVGGERLSAFIVEKDRSGVSLGPEERKTGLKGSSTRPLVLSDAMIPKENLLGGVGKGVRIASSTLNLGRFKLGAATTASCKLVLQAAVEYARTRAAFGRPITDFGLIKHKLAEMAILAYVGESMVYRTAGMIDHRLEGVEGDQALTLKGIEEYDVECSMVKVWCSEALDYAVDQNVQIFGGSGYVEDYPAERYWRDARVNRIFEGTSEINRLLISSRLVHKALRGDLPLLEKAMAVLAEAASGVGPAAEADSSGPPAANGFLGVERRMLAGAKTVALMCLGAFMRKYEAALGEEQEILGLFADVAMQIYALESAVLRATKRARVLGENEARLQQAAVRCFAQDAVDRIEVSARRLLAAVEEGDTLRELLAALRRSTRRTTLNTVELRRLIAAAAVLAGGYPLS